MKKINNSYHTVESIPIGHLKVSIGTLSQMLDVITWWISEEKVTQRACIPLNLSKYVMAKSDAKLANVIKKADLVVADGVPIVWLARRLGRSDVVRITGIELAEALLSLAQQRSWRVYFLGAKPENLEKALINVQRKFNAPPIAGARHGYFDQNAITDIVKEINDVHPDILLLGLGLPQKEYFVSDHLGKLNVPFTLTVGGAFDIWAGVKKRTPYAVQKVGMEWAWRSLYDSSRAQLIARYGLHFLKDLVWPKE